MPFTFDVLRSIVSRIAFWDVHPLKDRGFGLIYDRDRDITWLQDTNYARTIGHTPDGQMTWYQAMAWVKSLSYYGITGWRLPSALNHDGSGPCVGHDCNDSEIGYLFLVERAIDPTGVRFTNFQTNAKYWNSTEASPTEAYGWDFFSLRQGTVLKDPSTDPLGITMLTGPILSWPVHEGDVSSTILWRLITFRINSRFPIRRDDTTH